MAIMAAALVGWTGAAEEVTRPLEREAYLRRVWEANELIQMRMLEAAIGDQRHRAEQGIFEPEFTSGFEVVDRRRPNTSDQAVSSSFSRVFNERNQTYQTGLESLIHSGGKLRLGYSVQHMENNFHNQPPASFVGTPLSVLPNGEYLTTFGLSVTQPLLKGFGRKITTAGIRAAAINSDVSFQEYRKGLMEILARAELAYWTLYQAQEQYAISGESLRLAETLLADNRKRFEVGKAAELDVLQAEAGVAVRLALQREAFEQLSQARSTAASLVSEAWTTNTPPLAATDSPAVGREPLTFGELWGVAFENNPDYIGLQKRAELDGLRLEVARNQRLPQLDLKGGYGVSRINANASQSINITRRQDFPNWSVGLELRVPLTGGTKSKHELKAVELQQEADLLAIQNLETQLANRIRAGIHTVLSYRDNQPRYRQVVEFNQDVLTNQLARLQGGKGTSREVLEAEEDLFRARVSALENLVRYQRSSLDLELVVGAVLQNRNLEFTRDELRDRTEALTRSGRISRERYEEFLHLMRREYDIRRPGSP
jgi:outer membrane protein